MICDLFTEVGKLMICDLLTEVSKLMICDLFTEVGKLMICDLFTEVGKVMICDLLTEVGTTYCIRNTQGFGIYQWSFICKILSPITQGCFVPSFVEMNKL